MNKIVFLASILLTGIFVTAASIKDGKVIFDDSDTLFYNYSGEGDGEMTFTLDTLKLPEVIVKPTQGFSLPYNADFGGDGRIMTKQSGAIEVPTPNNKTKVATTNDAITAILNDVNGFISSNQKSLIKEAEGSLSGNKKSQFEEKVSEFVSKYNTTTLTAEQKTTLASGIEDLATVYPQEVFVVKKTILFELLK